MGIDLSKVVILTPDTQQKALWAAEQCLKSDCCHTVFGWNQNLEVHQVKRLQLAAKQGNAMHFTFQQQQDFCISLPVTMSLTLQAHVAGLKICMNKRIGSRPTSPMILDMQRYWPAFQYTDSTNPASNVIPFPHQKAI